MDVNSASFSAGLIESDRGRLRGKSSGSPADAEDDLGRSIWGFELYPFLRRGGFRSAQPGPLSGRAHSSLTLLNLLETDHDRL